MRAPVSLVEDAIVTTTGDPVRVLRRLGVRHDEQIMRALELAGHFVIGTPGGFRYRRKGKRKFTRPEPQMVFMIDGEGKATRAFTADYFAANYTIVKGDDL